MRSIEVLKKWVKNNRIYLSVLTVLVFLSYINSLNNSFVSDDRGLILNISSYNINSVFTQQSILRSLLYFITFKIGGLNPFLFRLPNIAFHLGSVYIVYALLSLWGKRWIGLISASLFAVHPILVESVNWISGGVYTQYSFFFLLSFFFYVYSKRSSKFYIASLVCFSLSLLSSEKAVVLSVVFFLYEFLFGDIKKNWKKTSIFFALSGVWFLLYFQKLGARQEYTVTQAIDQIPYNPILQIPISITSYFELMFWPDKLTLYHTELQFSQLEYVFRLILTVGFLGFLAFLFKKNRFLFFWLSFFIITLVPTLAPFGLAWIVAERYVYLGTLGIFVSLSWGIVKLFDHEKLRTPIIIATTIVIIAFSIRTIVRNIDWQNEDNLWLAAARTSPSSAQNHNNLGDYYGRHGDTKKAAEEFEKAIELKPNYADAYHNLGNAYVNLGQKDKALENYKKAISINPNIWQSYLNIASIYFAENDFKNSEEYILKGISVDPNNLNLKLSLGFVYAKEGNLQKARDIFNSVLASDPTNQIAKEALAQIEAGTFK